MKCVPFVYRQPHETPHWAKSDNNLIFKENTSVLFLAPRLHRVHQTRIETIDAADGERGLAAYRLREQPEDVHDND
jgi:hypothetical protein